MTIGNALRTALGIFSGKMICFFGTPERLRTLRCTLFTGRGVKGNNCFLSIGKTGKKCLHLGSFDNRITLLQYAQKQGVQEGKV